LNSLPICAGYQPGRLLIENDLVDELRLFVFLVVLGAGERLSGETRDQKPLRPIDRRTVGDGLVLLTYQLARDAERTMHRSSIDVQVSRSRDLPDRATSTAPAATF